MEQPLYHKYRAPLQSPGAAASESGRPGARTPQLLSLRAAPAEAYVLRAYALQQEKPPQWEACLLQRTVAPLAVAREALAAVKTQCNQKNKRVVKK